MALSQQEFDAMDKIVNEGQNIEFTPYEPEIPPTYQEGQPIKAQATQWAQIAPSRLIEQGVNELGGRILSAQEGLPIEQAREKYLQEVEAVKKEHPILTGSGPISGNIRRGLGWLSDQWLYGLAGKALKLGSTGLAGITGGFEATKEGKNPIKGALESAGIAKALGISAPYINKVKSAVAQKIVNSEKWKNLIEGLSGVSKKYTERLLERPQILTKALQKMRRNPNIDPSDVYGDTIESLASRAEAGMGKLKEEAQLTLDKIAREEGKKAKAPLSDEEVANIYNSLLKKYTSAGNPQNIAPETLADITEYLNKPNKTFYDLHLLKKDLLKDVSNRNVTKGDMDKNISHFLGNEINQALRTINPSYAQANDEAQKLINVMGKYFPKKPNEFDVPFGTQLANYGNLAQRTRGKYKAINEINDMLPSEYKFLDDLLDAQTVNMFMQKQPVVSTTEQILARKALPYAGMAVTGGSPAGFMAGITASGGLTSPQRYGRMTLEMLNKAGADPNKITPAQYRALRNQARVIGNIVSATLPREEEER